MKQPKTFLLLSVIVAILLLAVGYAAIGSVNLKVSGNVVATPDQGNFDVIFSGEKSYTTNGKGTVNLTASGTNASIDVSGLNAKGDKVTANFTILNRSNADIAASVTTSVTNSNTEYFSVTPSLSSNTINPYGGTETLTLVIELIKTPISGEQGTGIDITITAAPVLADMISFTVITDDGREILCYAEPGMDWNDWVKSDYYNSATGIYITGDPLDDGMYYDYVLSSNVSFFRAELYDVIVDGMRIGGEYYS